MARGRPKKQVNGIATQRIGIVLDELKECRGITQAQFAKLIHTSQQSVSKLKRGETELSTEYARSIANEFPQYRAEWLLGLDDFKSQEDLRAHLQAEARDKKNCVARSIELLAEQLGYQVTDDLMLDNESSDWEHPVYYPKSYFITKPDKSGVRVPRAAMRELQQEVLDFVDFKLGRIVKEQKDGD